MKENIVETHPCKSRIQSAVVPILVAGAVLLSGTWHADAQTALAVAEPGEALVVAQAVPLTGTFRSMTLMQPPFPFNPFPELPVYSLGDGTFVYNDSQVDYEALRAELAAEAVMVNSLPFSSSSVLLGGGGQLMSLSSPPPPGGGGGGSGGGGITSAPPYSVAGLKVTIPVLTNIYIYTTIFEHNPALAYDIYTKTNLNSTNWLFGIWGVAAQTNYYLMRSNYPGDAFLMAASGLDSDGDGLPDNWEAMNGLNPHLSDADSDTDGDGISNFDEWRYGLNPNSEIEKESF